MKILQKKIDTIVGLGVILLFAVLVAFIASQDISLETFVSSILRPSHPTAVLDFEKFTSTEDFKEYLQKSESQAYYGGGGFARSTVMLEKSLAVPTAAPSALDNGVGGGEEAANAIERVSETNVQVLGIDEPDIVKTDGKKIYFSPQNRYYWGWRGGGGVMMEKMIAPPEYKMEAKIINAFPPEGLAVDAKIDKVGDLLLKDNILVIFSGNTIYGYDVSDSKNPVEKWKADLGDRDSIVTSRLYKGKIYLVTSSYININEPCPIRPLTVAGNTVEIKCTDVYHPVAPVSTDITYTAMIMDPVSGAVEKTVSFIGSSNLASSIIYMSDTALYSTYSYSEGQIKFISDFILEKCQDLFPMSVIEKITKLNSYDISDTSKMSEIGIILQNYFNGLDNDEITKIENELTNRMSDYYKEHKRELEKTGIVKIGLEDFSVKATGVVPGFPLNQFSLDEYNGNLRIATTVGQNGMWVSGLGSTSGSANDVYVLDGDLKIMGAIYDLGLTERIYSARFIEDKGYLVTFKRIDPFYVLDLSDPSNPSMKGELKIPGFSSYLHPIAGDIILGVGQEDWKVKLSLFNVADPSNPTEVSKYILEDGWTEVSNNHHAFLLDKKHGVFFLPGSGNGYIFSYNGNNLKMEKAVSDIQAKRAIYINDYLYIIGENKVVVLNELNWTIAKELEL